MICHKGQQQYNKPFTEVMDTLTKVSSKAGHQAMWLALRVILSSSFNNEEESFITLVPGQVK